MNTLCLANVITLDLGGGNSEWVCIVHRSSFSHHVCLLLVLELRRHPQRRCIFCFVGLNILLILCGLSFFNYEEKILERVL